MKKTFFTLAFVASLFLAGTASAQVSITVNIDKQPVWGPTGYEHVDYYYLPEIDVYYNVPEQKYVYLQGNKWVSRKSLPGNYKQVDMYKTYKVVVNGDKPYLHHDEDKKKYAPYKDKHNQPVIRDSKEEKYFVNKNHPEHKEWQKQQKQEKQEKKQDKKQQRKG